MKPESTLDDLLKEVSRDFGIVARKIKSKGRSGSAAKVARDELCRRMYLAGYSQSEIGRFLGKRDQPGISKAIVRAIARRNEANRS